MLALCGPCMLRAGLCSDEQRPTQAALGRTRATENSCQHKLWMQMQQTGAGATQTVTCTHDRIVLCFSKRIVTVSRVSTTHIMRQAEGGPPHYSHTRVILMPHELLQ